MTPTAVDGPKEIAATRIGLINTDTGELIREIRTDVSGLPGAEHVDADEIEIATPTQQDDELLAVQEALDALAAHDARKAELVKLRYFAGLTIEEAADVLDISAPTAKRDWTYARAWLFRAISRA